MPNLVDPFDHLGRVLDGAVLGVMLRAAGLDCSCQKSLTSLHMRKLPDHTYGARRWNPLCRSRLPQSILKHAPARLGTPASLSVSVSENEQSITMSDKLSPLGFVHSLMSSPSVHAVPSKHRCESLGVSGFELIEQKPQSCPFSSKCIRNF